MIYHEYLLCKQNFKNKPYKQKRILNDFKTVPALFFHNGISKRMKEVLEKTGVMAVSAVTNTIVICTKAYLGIHDLGFTRG